MKSLFLFIGSLLFASSSALADFATYTKDSFALAQKNNEKILLHFSADWCPTCRAQKSTFAELEKMGLLKGIVLLTADYDKEEELKKQLKVTHQSTLIAFYGAVETGRATGQTSKEDLSGFVHKNLISLTLKDQLRLMTEASAQKIPPEKRKVMDEAIEKLRATQLEAKALKVGQAFPAFDLKNSDGKKVTLKQLLKTGPVVISFYRGSWCPYCNAQLSDFQKHLTEIKSHGATLIGVTPEKPELEATLKEGKRLEFEILFDENNKLAGKLGLVYGITPELKAIYQQFGIDLAKTQGNSDWNLPVPATYVIGKNGKIVFAFVDVDYKKRADTAEVIGAIPKN